MKNNLQKSVLRGITDIFRPLLTVAPDRNSTVDFFRVLGWDVEALLEGDIAPLTNILSTVAQEVAQVNQVIGAAETPSIESLSKLKASLLATKKLGQALAQLNTLSLPGDLADNFYPDVLQKLLTIYLLLAAERVYYFFALVGIIVPDTLSEQQNGRYVKYVSTIPVFSFDRLLEFLKSPQEHIAGEYWPNGEDDFATQETTTVVA